MAKSLSIVVPVFQNEANLHTTIPTLMSLGKILTEYELELVMVEDGSRDRSYEILQLYADKYPANMTLVKLTRNFGQVPAIQAGLRHASGDCVGIISADLQEPWEALIEMVHAWERGGKFIIGERSERAEQWWHRTVSGTYWYLVRRFAFPDYPTMGYDFCLLDRQIVEELNRINEKNTSIFVLAYWLGYKPVRVPIKRYLRKGGVSQWSFIRKVGFTIDMLIGFTYLPARSISLMGFGVALGSLLYLTFALVQWYRLGTAPLGWMTVVGLLTLLGASILVAIGILSEYLLRILDEARKRPPYVIECVSRGETDRKRAGNGEIVTAFETELRRGL
jgi:glycosyltransferase involved in cell wall biosynthesis